MATGDLLFFDEAKAYMIDGGWEAADDIKVAFCDNTVNPAVADAAPIIGDYTQVGSSGNYTSGGYSIGNLGALITEASGTVKFDSATNPVTLQHASNDNDAYWAIGYNATQGVKLCLFFVELGGPVDMSAGDLTVTWHADGIATLT